MSQRISVSILGKSGPNEPQIQALTGSRCNSGAVYLLFDIMGVTDFEKLGLFQ
jgi:hypothetical protein